MTWVLAVAIALAGLGLVPGGVEAATIYGTIHDGDRPLADAAIELSCGGRRVAGRTDDRGAYRFTVGQTGRCELRAAGSSAPVILYEQPIRYDFEVRRHDGRAGLIRR
jgi:hypothetical protein